MAEAYQCFNCSKIAPLMGGPENKCPSCGSTNGEVLSKEQFEKSLEAGASFNIDLKTGKRAKKRK